MAKQSKKPSKAAKPRAAAPVEGVRIADGSTVSPACLTHITPALWPLAVPVESLKQDPRNARQHGERNREAIRFSLKQFGQQRPISVDADGVILAGNGTHAEARALGWRYVAAVRSHLKGAAARAYAIADNRTGELATWDAEELQATLDELDAADFDVAGLEFTDAELDSLAAGEEPEADGGAGGKTRGSGSGSGEYREQFKIVIECDGEEHQAALLDRLGAEGLKVRALVG